MKQLCDTHQVQEIIDQLADGLVGLISSDREKALVGIRRRGVPLAERLAVIVEEKTEQKLPVGTLDIAFYRDDLSHVAQQPLVGTSELPFSIDDREIYLIDDVLYTGRTIRAALEALLAYGRPSRIVLLVLIDRGHRELPIKADIVGKCIETKASDNIQVHLKEIDGQDEVTLERVKRDD